MLKELFRSSVSDIYFCLYNRSATHIGPIHTVHHYLLLLLLIAYTLTLQLLTRFERQVVFVGKQRAPGGNIATDVL
jgi:hypothetical protein